MSTALLNLETKPLAVTAMSFIDRSHYVLIDQTVSGDSREAIYQRTVGQVDTPATLRVGVYSNPKSNNGYGQTNVSLKWNTFLETTDGDDVVTNRPASFTLAWTMPGATGVPVAAEVLAAVQQLVSWVCHLDGGTFDTDVLNELAYGIVVNMDGHSDTAV